MIARLVVFIFILSVFAMMPASAQESFDPFHGNAAKSPDTSNSSASRGRAALPSTLFDLKLSTYEQDKFNQCRTDAKDNGKDIMELRSASDFIDTKYNDPECSKFVVEKMLFSMELAMKNDPEALNEFQRSKDAQRKYDNLKKAYTALNHGNPMPQQNNTSTAIMPSPVTRLPSTNSMVLQPGSVDLFPSDQNPITIIPKPVIPQEWWAKDYYYFDTMQRQQRQDQIDALNNRPPSTQGAGPTPLQSMMMDKQQAQYQNDNRGRRTPAAPPNGANYPYQQ